MALIQHIVKFIVWSMASFAYPDENLASTQNPRMPVCFVCVFCILEGTDSSTDFVFIYGKKQLAGRGG